MKKIVIDSELNCGYKGEAMADEVVLPVRTCNICAHTWIPRKSTPPQKCPECNSPNWNRTEFIRPSKRRASVGPVLESASSVPAPASVGA
jgi:hypothetical protein